eukprot:4529318-Amphidinium_carterae.2
MLKGKKEGGRATASPYVQSLATKCFLPSFREDSEEGTQNVTSQTLLTAPIPNPLLLSSSLPPPWHQPLREVAKAFNEVERRRILCRPQSKPYGQLQRWISAF